MKTCPNCGTQMADEAKFCESCGVSLEQNNAGAQAAQPVDNNQGAPMNGPAPVPMQPVAPQYNGYQQYYDPKDHTAEFDPRDIADNKFFATCAYLFGIFGIIIALIVNNSSFARFHAKQAVKYEICALVVLIPMIIPFLGWFISGCCFLALFVVKIIAIVNVLKGKAVELPIISEIGFLKG
ncbi:MAG: zinc-ribbon domain-containing protein [Butyrivibrio sp.]|nr:zinc-ribbon domain-containing protein [Butyrivibrio sp.]